MSADYEDAYGYRLGQFITGQRTAYQAGTLDPAWIAELEDLGMIWDDHEATWLGHLATVEAFQAEHGHLAIPTQLPGSQFLADQRALARKGRLTPDRDNQLTALDPDWKLPYGPDWHRKYHLLRRHLKAGNHLSTLRRDMVIHGVKAGSWLHRQLTGWPDLDPGRRDLLARMGITPRPRPPGPGAHRGGACSRRPPRSSGSSWHGGDAPPAPGSGSRWTATVS
ncbi:helicase associated domain-containing protein [Streptomyces stelliscabiei]|uniref:helicase associated domain-containing protein n=1 Tax=Streptomyces stelliscabiei TaxID=146820 RepID=UPI002FF41426